MIDLTQASILRGNSTLDGRLRGRGMSCFYDFGSSNIENVKDKGFLDVWRSNANVPQYPASRILVYPPTK